jgi:hypothetical protein
MSMTNSILFYSRPNSGIINGFMHYDCCEHLGSNLNDYGVKEAYIAIPIKELHPFFKNNPQMLIEYTRFITEAFDVEFRMATPEEIATIQWSGSKFTAANTVVIKHTRKTNIPNKYFNSAYNVLRYLWYQHYTIIAIVATNLYLLEVASAMDVLAIASSFQSQNSRALLPARTDTTDGILFFRPKEDILKGLKCGTLFNTVFYKYPIYFNPTVEVSGSFFSEAKNIVAAKETFARLADLDNIADLPGFVRNNIRIIMEDYVAMKEAYSRVAKQIDSMGVQMSFSVPLLLKRNMVEEPATFIDPAGRTTVKYLTIAEDNTITFKSEGSKKQAKKPPRAEEVLIDEDLEEEEDE